jgi:hypothetical protein
MALSRSAMAEARSPGLSVLSTDSATFAPTPLHGLQQAEPFALDIGENPNSLI